MILNPEVEGEGVEIAAETGPRIVIVGRPNVGKSTLFNRLVGRRRSLVHNEPGVTRDRIEEKCEWWVQGKRLPVVLIDTGGLGGDQFREEIRDQVQTALNTAHLILFLFDSQAGVTPLDRELMTQLTKSGIFQRIPVLGIVNKVDAEQHEDRIADFYELGLENLYTVSAEHSRGLEDLRIEIAKHFPSALSSPLPDPEEQDPLEDQEQEKAPKIPRIAIVGRPNVGKSTLLNAILGENRVITSPIAGTTVDSVDIEVQFQGKTFLFVDTAGIRRKSKTQQGVEVLSIVQTRKALEKADVAILVLDGEVGISDQDEKIGGLIEEIGCSMILAVNKWDTQRKNKDFKREDAAQTIRDEMGFLKYAPIVFMSAKKRQGIDGLGDLIEEILYQRKLKLTTKEFTDWIREESTVHNPANAKFFLCHQSGRHPPTFVCHVNDPEKVHFSLKRYLLNALRARWGYMGSPVRLLFVEANRRSLPRKK